MYDPNEMDAASVESYLTNSLLGMRLEKNEVQEDLFRVFIQLLGEGFVGTIYVEQGRTYLHQALKVNDVPILTIRIKHWAEVSHGYTIPHDVYSGFRVAMDGLLADNIRAVVAQS